MATHPIALAQTLVCLFFGVLFLQSGSDKVIDWKGNLDWLTGHFSATPLKSLVPLMLAMITFLECAAGVAGIVAALVPLGFLAMPALPTAALFLSSLALLLLFAGQRIAKDYAGAATLATYFGVAMIGFYVISLKPN